MKKRKHKFSTFRTALPLNISKNFQFSIFLAFCLLHTAAQAQTEEPSERILQWEQEIASGNLDAGQMLDKYEWLMWEYYPRDMEKTRHYFREAVAYAKKNKPEIEPKLIARMGFIFSQLNVIDSASIYFDKAISLVESIGDEWEMIVVYELAGSYFTDIFELENGINFYFKALNINEKYSARLITENKNITESIKYNIRIRANIAITYMQMLNYEKCLEGLLETKKLINENREIDFSDYEYFIDGNICGIYLHLHEFEKSFPYTKNYYESAVARGDLVSIADASVGLSMYYQHTGELHKALKHAKEALEIAEKIQAPVYMNRAGNAVAQTYIQMNDYKSALYYTKHELARTDENNYDALRIIYSNFIIIYAGLNDMTNVMQYIKEYEQLHSNISNADMHNAIQEMQVKYDVQQKDFELERKQSEIEKQKSRQIIYIGGLIAAGLLLTMFIFIIRQRNRRNRELAETNTTKDKFFSIISHDLKNPAISQREALQLLYDNAEIWNASELKLYYQELLKSADGQVDLLHDLLNWSQVQTGRMPYQPKIFDLVAKLRKTEISLLSGIAERKGVELNITIPARVQIYGDSNMLVTVVRNLLVNAIKFTPKGGVVTFEVLTSTSFGGGQEEAYIISIADTGIGMSKEQLQKLLLSDHKTSRSGTAGEVGVGLGLIVCKEFLEKHDSHLNIESQEGKGSRFWFEMKCVTE